MAAGSFGLVKNREQPSQPAAMADAKELAERLGQMTDEENYQKGLRDE
jgi:hypothetical protein